MHQMCTTNHVHYNVHSNVQLQCTIFVHYNVQLLYIQCTTNHVHYNVHSNVQLRNGEAQINRFQATLK